MIKNNISEILSKMAGLNNRRSEKQLKNWETSRLILFLILFIVDMYKFM